MLAYAYQKSTTINTIVELLVEKFTSESHHKWSVFADPVAQHLEALMYIELKADDSSNGGPVTYYWLILNL